MAQRKVYVVIDAEEMKAAAVFETRREANKFLEENIGSYEIQAVGAFRTYSDYQRNE